MIRGAGLPASAAAFAMAGSMNSAIVLQPGEVGHCAVGEFTGDA